MEIQICENRKQHLKSFIAHDNTRIIVSYKIDHLTVRIPGNYEIQKKIKEIFCPTNFTEVKMHYGYVQFLQLEDLSIFHSSLFHKNPTRCLREKFKCVLMSQAENLEKDIGDV